MMWDWGTATGFSWFMGFGIILTILFWGCIIALIVWGIKKFSGNSASSGSPLDIARRRYARGEISRDEFEQIKQDLS